MISNTNEGTIFVNQSVLAPVNYTFPQYIGQLFPHLDNDQIQRVVDLYSTEEDPKAPLEQAAEVMSDSEFRDI